MGQVKIKQMDTPHCVPWTYISYSKPFLSFYLQKNLLVLPKNGYGSNTARNGKSALNVPPSPSLQELPCPNRTSYRLGSFFPVDYLYRAHLHKNFHLPRTIFRGLKFKGKNCQNGQPSSYRPVAVPVMAVVGAAVVEAELEAHADVSESCARMSLIQSRCAVTLFQYPLLLAPFPVLQSYPPP